MVSYLHSTAWHGTAWHGMAWRGMAGGPVAALAAPEDCQLAQLPQLHANPRAACAHPSPAAGNWRHLVLSFGEVASLGQMEQLVGPAVGDSAAAGPGFCPMAAGVGQGGGDRHTRTSICSPERRTGIPLTFPLHENQSRSTLGLSPSCPMSPRPKEPCSLCTPCLQLGTGAGFRHGDGGRGMATSGCPLGAPCRAHDGAATGQK